jgi:hypothetical protein
MKNQFVALALLSLLATVASAAPSTDPLHELQALGARIKAASELAKNGKQPDSASLADFEHRLQNLHASMSTDLLLQRKYQAIAALFGNLQHQPLRAAPAKQDKAPRAQVDVEVVTDRHGATCANALGISEQLPVSLTLGQAGAGRSDVWFRFEPHADRSVRFATDSSGPDPALEVFNGCGTGAAKIAGNDDAIGLDSAVSVSASRSQALFVHLTNSGQGGRMQVSAATAAGTINGAVKEQKTGLTLANAHVALFDTNSNFVADGYADAGGNYSIAVYNPGDYYVRADGGPSGPHVPELYPLVQCFPSNYSYSLDLCNVAQAQTVTVNSGATVSNINFALSLGQRISGEVRDAANQPIYNAVAYLYDGSGNNLTGLTTDNFGRYVFSTLPPGNYKVEAQASGYGSAMFNQIACGGPLQTDCDLSQAAMLAISNQDVSGINFSLPLLSAISGTVTATSVPVPNIEIQVLDANNNFVGWSWTDPNGRYTIGPLATGSYHVQATPAAYFGQVFDGIDCATDCAQELASATNVVISTFGQQAEADFHLTALPTVSGHVQDAVSGLPMANVSVQVGTNPPAQFWWSSNSAVTDANGNYTLSGTPPGQYYVWAQSDDHVDQLYPGITCEYYGFYYAVSCDSANATLLTIALGQTPGAFNFALDASASFGGQALTRAGAGSDLPANVQIHAYDSTGAEVAEAMTDALGNYVIPDLPAGTYFAEAQGSFVAYITQIWQQMDCTTSCDPTTGTSIPLTAGATTGDIDFSMTRLDAVVGRVTNSQGDPVGGTIVDLFDSSTGLYQSSAIADAQGYYAAQAYTNYGYYVATEVGPGYVDQLYAGISCPLGPAYYGSCPFTNASAVTLDSGATQPAIVDFTLQVNDPIFANGFE